MQAIYRAIPPSQEGQEQMLREQQKKEVEYFSTLSDLEKKKLNPHCLLSGNRAYNDYMRRQAENTL